MRTALNALAASFAMCLLTACDSPSAAEPVFLPGPPPAPDPPAFLSPVGEWRVTLLRGEPVPDGVTPPRLAIEPDGSVSGFQGANRYTGVLDPDAWDRGVFAYRAGSQTMMARRNPQAHEVASSYTAALYESTMFTFRSGGLELRNKDGDVILRFERATPEGEWRLASLRGEAVPPGARTPTLTVDAEGRVAGFAGVNLYWATVSPGGWFRGDFKVGTRIESTLVGGSEEAMDAESRYLAALGEANRFAVRSGALELSNDDGIVILRFEAARH